MLTAIDLTGDMISYAYLEGNEISSEILRNTIGFRTPDLFHIDGAINGIMRLAKDMIELSVGDTIKSAICILPLYAGYNDRERLKHAAAECGISVKKVITGSLASAFGFFQDEELGKNTFLLGTAHSDHTEFLLFEVDGDVLTPLGSAMIQYEKDPRRLEPEGLKKKMLSELKAMYAELGREFQAEDGEVCLTFDENSEYLKRLFSETLEKALGTEPVIFENAAVKGALTHLMKLESERCELIKKCFFVDTCTEEISISSGIGGELKEVFRRNTPLPVQNTVELMVSSDNVLCFYAGNYRNREYDEPIGTCRIPSAYLGQPVYVKITLTEDAIVEYLVLDSKKQIIYPRQVLK